MEKFLLSKGGKGGQVLSSRDCITQNLLATAAAAATAAAKGSSCNSSNCIIDKISSSSNINNTRVIGVKRGRVLNNNNNGGVDPAKTNRDDGDVWNDYMGGGRGGAQVTATDIAISHTKMKLDNQKDLKGWKIKGGEKVYQTFRAGKLISATGREAFALSMADEKKNGNKKEGLKEKDKDDNTLNDGKIRDIPVNSSESKRSKSMTVIDYYL